MEYQNSRGVQRPAFHLGITCSLEDSWANVKNSLSFGPIYIYIYDKHELAAKNPFGFLSRILRIGI